ncbi:hypothetical protein ACSW9O_15490 (plasmid) [Clostridium perfringens]|nr:hypothetical protein [Clostridium perfringens]
MITNTTSNLNISNDKLITIKISEELAHALLEIEEGIRDIYKIANMEVNSINRSVIIKNLIELGLRSDKNILRIDRHSWSPIEILNKRYPDLQKIKSIDDLDISDDEMNNAFISAELYASLDVLDFSEDEEKHIKELARCIDENQKIVEEEYEIVIRTIALLFNEEFELSSLTKKVLNYLVRTKAYGVVSIYQAIDTYVYNILLKELFNIALKAITEQKIQIVKEQMKIKKSKREK